jgi:hypothetical protein
VNFIWISWIGLFIGLELTFAGDYVSACDLDFDEREKFSARANSFKKTSVVVGGVDPRRLW